VRGEEDAKETSGLLEVGLKEARGCPSSLNIMATLSDLKLKYRIFMRTYRYRQFDWCPGTVLQKPLSQARVAVVTSAALYRPDQPPFDSAIRGGDYSFREIALETDLDTLRIAHKSDAFDHSGIESDKNLAMPLDRLRELKTEARIGDVASVHYSLMGSISAPARLVSITAPAIARRLSEDDVDGVLLTPV
jgi:D-proline reductase (dithiol) PrdB